MARGCPHAHCPLPRSQHRRRRGVARRLYPDQQQRLPEQPADECGAAGHGPDWVDLRGYRFGDDYRRDRSVCRCYLRHGPVLDDSDEHRLGVVALAVGARRCPARCRRRVRQRIHHRQTAHPSIDYYARNVLFVNRFHCLIRAQPAHPDAGAAALQPGLRPESIWSARFALIVGRSHRIHTYPLDIGNRADPDARPFPHRLWPSCDLHRQQPAGCSRDRRANRPHEDRRLHDLGWIGRADRFDYCYCLGLRGSGCRRQQSDPARHRRRCDRGHRAYGWVRHCDRRVDRRLRHRLPQQWLGASGRPSDGVQHLPRCGDPRGYDPQCASGCCAGAEEALMVDAAPVILEAEHLSKRFGAVTALTDVSLRLHRGEVLGLVGDNGAGKSTLIKILCGFHKPDSGTYTFDGKPVNLSSPIEARAMGIQTVYQDLALVNDLSVFHNMFLGRERKKRILGVPLLDNRSMRRLTIEYLSNLGIRIPNVDNTVSMLSGGQRQSIAVARSIFSNPTVLIMDEPLAALGVRESRLVLNLVLALKKRGDISIILIAHNYGQVFEVCDRINFLSGGKIVYDTRTADTTVADLVNLVTSGYTLSDSAPVAGTTAFEAP